ncbi:FAD-binding and (Fe-S)-binding domain-containing protein [Corynebacterium freiburgense]|uniref:FAD-binding and (Fe-S)-binding domain-containing protein n=1 Tax=Corynebacterium freiburgense TaxID=556548 RepID=UPI00040EE94B|nr:FAD-binding and (Fe-S)-binding domain-containing protein [Corynebacterium freiburgense]WJZ02106.1 putative FAD-linked oxidoreductase [Corynebacterium freiburgense]
MSVTTSRSLLSQGNTAALEALRAALGADTVSTRELDRMALAVDASHYLHTPDAVMRAKSPTDIGIAMRIAAEMNWPLTFRGGGTSLSGQALSEGLTVDVRRHFRGMEVLDNGKRVRVQPGLTISQVNATLARYGTKLGPDPASSIACTIGGMIANNSSGMTCGTTANAYRTIDSMTIVLPSGTVINTAAPNADEVLRSNEPALVEVLERLRDTLRGDAYRADIERRYAIKNTMGYGINSFLDFDTPAKILEHLMIGSEGTLGFVAEAVFNTVPVPKRTATGLLMFDSLDAATNALPTLVHSGADVVELIDAASIQAMGEDAANVLPKGFQVNQHASLLVEYQAMDDDGIAERITAGKSAFEQLGGLATAPELTNSPDRRAQMWVMRNGLYTKIMRNRPKGTMALLEDIAVPMEQLGGVCTELQELFVKHNYDGAVIFGHAKNGNIHFLVTEDFAGPASLNRYDAFTEDMVDLVLREEGTLKAEHGTGRIMSPFVRRQYGDDLYQAMVDIKDACDPKRILNPGTIITDDPELHLKHIKPTESVREIIDDCVECGYCEPVCPSQHLTTTPRQRIVIQRAIAACEATGAYDLAERLKEQEVYDVTQTCAVDGMCLTACPVKINTGDLIREKRRETQSKTLDKGWKIAAEHWGKVLRGASIGMSMTHAAPTPPLRTALGLARKVAGEDIVPTLTSELPGGGKIRTPKPTKHPDAIFMPACVGTMFGTEHACGKGVADAVRDLAQYAGLQLSTPSGIQDLCCGTPWKSKGLAQGYDVMKNKLTEWIVEHTQQGAIPLICDNVSCTEGIIVALRNAGIENIRVLDATEWVAEHIAPLLPPLPKARRAAVHPTCSSTHLGVNNALMMLAGLVAEEATIPDGWRCCAFAGDRGLLHEELTATSTRDEARSVAHMNADLFLSCNRTCELGLTRATGHTYVHVLEELAARVADRIGQH